MTLLDQVSLCSVSSKSSKVKYISVSCIDYGFVFNLNENLDETKAYALQQKLNLPKKIELLKTRPQLLDSLRRLLLKRDSIKVFFEKSKDIEALSKIWGGPPITQSHRDKVLQGSFEFIEKSPVNKDIVSELSISQRSYLYEIEICELATISLAILVNHLISIK